jgi:hypothetical protein
MATNYPQHWLLAMGGQLTGTSGSPEIWQCTIRGIPGVEAAYGDEDAVLANIAPGVQAWFTAAASRIRNDANLQYLKLNQITPDGRYADPVTHQHDFSPAPTGQIVAGMPAILTVAWSWTTAAARGLAHTGRIYPPVAIDSQPSSQISNAAAYVAAAQKLLDAVSASPDTSPGTNFMGLAPRVVSSQGVIREITGVRVGNVIDVQRRRKDAIQEVYSAGPWPTS